MNSFNTGISAQEAVYFAGRAAIALGLGAVIGLERQWRQRMAGLRTNALVALGAALFVLFGVLISGQQGSSSILIAAYVVSGVGFLGAGVIMRDGVSVRGINTAATIWCSAAVGVLSGAGFLVEALIGTVFVVAVHLALRRVALRIDRLPTTEDTEVDTAYRFRSVCRSADEAHIRSLVVQALTRGEFVLQALRSVELDAGADRVEVEAVLRRVGRDDVALEQAVSRLSLESSVSSVSWSVIEPVGALVSSDE
jgi:putative Mg2+ transporter-C (MgtC) family protein